VLIAGSFSRLFSSRAKSLLLDALAKKEKEEKASRNTKMPKRLKHFKSSIEVDWTIVEDGAMTSLLREVHSHKVQVSFHCQDTEEDVTDNVNESEKPSCSVRFSVTVTKAGKSLVFVCFSEYGGFRIEGVSTTTASAETVHDNGGTLAKKEHQGSDFSDLQWELQGELENYLEKECGVNTTVVAFVIMFSDYREHVCFSNWLQETQTIVLS
jgi:hypothetical protein